MDTQEALYRDRDGHIGETIQRLKNSETERKRQTHKTGTNCIQREWQIGLQ